VTEIEDGFTFDCLNPQPEIVQSECTFVNERTAANIPTLSEWGMIAAAAGLGLVGVFFAVKRLRASSRTPLANCRQASCSPYRSDRSQNEKGGCIEGKRKKNDEILSRAQDD